MKTKFSRTAGLFYIDNQYHIVVKILFMDIKTLETYQWKKTLKNLIIPAESMRNL
jgi:hypothetical protein